MKPESGNLIKFKSLFLDITKDFKFMNDNATFHYNVKLWGTMIKFVFIDYTSFLHLITENILELIILSLSMAYGYSNNNPVIM